MARAKTSKKPALAHGLSLIGFVLRMIVEKRPLLLLGVPGSRASEAFLVAGTSFGVWMLQIYANEHRIITNIALASIAFALIGLFAVFTAVTLHAILRATQRIHNGKQG